MPNKERKKEDGKTSRNVAYCIHKGPQGTLKNPVVQKSGQSSHFYLEVREVKDWDRKAKGTVGGFLSRKPPANPPEHRVGPCEPLVHDVLFFAEKKKKKGWVIWVTMMLKKVQVVFLWTEVE